MSIAPMHTCEHIVNGTMCKLFGCGRAVSAHIEKKKSKLDYVMDQPLSEAQLRELESVVNEVISRDLEVTVRFISQEEAASSFDLSRLPERASETMRVVDVGDYDSCLCIGAHVKRTSEIGAFRITTCDFRDGIFRIRFKLDGRG